MSLPKVQDTRSAVGLNTPAITDLTIDKGKAQINGLGLDIPLTEIVSFTRAEYAAGTARVVDYDLDSIETANGKAYNFTFKKIINNATSPVVADTVNERTYVIHLSDGHDELDVRDELISRINNDPSAFFSAAEVGGNVRVTVDSADYDIELTESPSGVTSSNNVNYVEPNGTVTQLENYAPGDSTSGATYTTYVIEFYEDLEKAFLGNDKVGKKQRAVVFAKDDATNYADFDTTIQRVFGTEALDDVHRGKIYAEEVAITGNDTLTSDENVAIVTGAGGYTLTLPDPMEFGKGLMLIRNNATTPITVSRASAADTVDGGASKTVYEDSGLLLHCDGYSAWVSIIDSVDVS